MRDGTDHLLLAPCIRHRSAPECRLDCRVFRKREAHHVRRMSAGDRQLSTPIADMFKWVTTLKLTTI